MAPCERGTQAKIHDIPHAMKDFQELRQVVQRNCNIADAQFAGNYSMCTYLLKMREYYRWEKQAELTDELDKSDVGEWIGERESFWEDVASLDYQRVPVNRRLLDPFDNDSINESLNPAGLVYAGGIGMFGQPEYFLGELRRAERRDDLTVYVSGIEYARALAASPAMMTGRNVYVRRESLRRVIWEMAEEWQWRRRPGPMAWIAQHYDLDNDVSAAIARITDNEVDSLIAHEIGEWEVEQLFGTSWQSVLDDALGLPVEQPIRAIRDLLADCISTLPALLERENAPSLHFYFANLRGWRRQLFPRAVIAYEHWVENNSLDSLRSLVPRAGEHWHQVATDIVHGHQENPEDLAAVVDDLVRHRAVL